MERSCRVIALMGSGETSPTMVTVHRELVARLGGSPTAILLDTPYGFQENADDISARAQRYFERSVGLRVAAPSLRAPADDPEAASSLAATIRTAGWLFSGPGSPTYALDQWRGTPVADALADRVRAAQGVSVFASAAACVVGRVAVPVYEVYKVGAPPHWLDGLDLLAAIGLDVAVIPHYDNAEGGTHDTRYAYLGERRLRLMERELPDGIAVLGVDEHTAALVDLDAGTVDVRGRGGLTVRRDGASTVVPADEGLTLDELRDLLRGLRRQPAGPGTGLGGATGGQGADQAEGPAGPARARPEPTGPASLREAIADCVRRFEAALARQDAGGLAQAVLDLDIAITEWSADLEEEDEDPEAARAIQRGLVARLGELAALGLRDPRDALSPMVDALVEVRADLRGGRHWTLADAVRDALRAGGIDLRDTRQGTEWELLPADARDGDGQPVPDPAAPAGSPAAEPPAAPSPGADARPEPAGGR